MRERGPGSNEPGPRSVDAEIARRRLYMPGGGSGEAVDEFLRLADEAQPPADPEPPVPARTATDAAAIADEPPVRRRRIVIGAAAVAGAAVVVVLALLLQAVGPHPLPASVPIPRLGGTTLLYHQRMSNPESAPSHVTFDPASYTVFEAQGRRVGVALRCVGAGTVRISASQRFTFRCTARESLQMRMTPSGVTAPFLILGRTVGNVVWSVRVVLLPRTG